MAVAELAWKPCPNCNGLGELPLTPTEEDMPCLLCVGRGVVSPYRVCFNCGRPAYEVKHNHEVCGREACVKAAAPVAVVPSTGAAQLWDWKNGKWVYNGGGPSYFFGD